MHRAWSRSMGCTAVVVSLAVTAAAPASALGARRSQRVVVADFFGQRTPPLKSGQIELITLSTLPATVTGGDVLAAVRGLRPGDRLRVIRNRRNVTGAFGPLVGNERRGLVDGLREDSNWIVATVRRGRSARRVLRMRVRNHPVTGPVLSGPHQRPFYCQTEASGLGKPLDEHCSIRPRVQWFYRSSRDQGYHELEDPYAAYPSDVMRTRTSGGDTVPFVVRVETATINRGIARIAVLDDPAARGRGKPFRASNWNRRVTYAFGESCGVGYRQGTSGVGVVLGGPPTGIGADSAFASVYGTADRLARGDLVAHSTLTTFGVYCNPLVSAETLMMIKEHVIERYGPIERTVGVGGSGGALQQYSAANNFPGLLDPAIPIASFTDVPSTAMTVVDCGLLVDYFGRSRLAWSDQQRAAVAGHATPRICQDWVALFLSNLHPTEGCSSVVPREVRYDRERNPGGVRCTLQDATVNIWGRDPATGFARRPYDNVGVQYGLRALNAGQIRVEQFLDLNREIGGYDLDARRVAQRSAMEPETAQITYRIGGVIGRGALAQIPVIDLASYLDLVPLLDIHDVVRPFQVRARLAERGLEASQSIWRGLSLPTDAQPAIEAWLDGMKRSTAQHRAVAVAADKPDSAGDRCVVAAGGRLDAPDALTLPLGFTVQLLPGAFPPSSAPLQFALPERQDADTGLCQTAFPARAGTRIVAGGPFTDDVIKCQLKPVDRRDYAAALTEAQLAELRRIFPAGVCDWSRPAVGDVPRRSMLWPSLGGARLRTAHELRWTGVRSR